MKKILNYLFNVFKFLIYYIYYKLTIFSLLLGKIKNKKYLYTNHFGFGDFVVYCYIMKQKIFKKKIFCYSKLQYDIAKFFFEKKYIEKSIILLPKFLSESHLGPNFLEKNKNFTPTKTPDWRMSNNTILPTHYWFPRNTQSILYAKRRIQIKKISSKLNNFFKKPTILFFIKNFSQKKRNHLNFQVRQTRDLKKIFKLFVFLKKKKINILLLGNNNDHFIQIARRFLKNKKFSNINFLIDLSKNYSINDQVFAAHNSIGYLGSSSGGNIFSLILKKKMIIIDSPYWYADKYWKNIKFLYKKIYDKKLKTTKRFLWQKNYDEKRYKIIENDYESIKKTLILVIKKYL